MTVSKALLLNVGVFEASLNVRRSRGAYSLNYQNANYDFNSLVRNILAGGQLVCPNLSTSPSVTIIRVNSGPVMAAITLGVVAGLRTVPEVVNIKINQFFILDDNVQSITLSNQGSATVNVAITQG